MKLLVLCISILYLSGCANGPCFDVSVSGRLPTDGWGTARGELCAPEPKENK